MHVVGSHEPVGGGPSSLLNLCLWQPVAGRASGTGFLRLGRSLRAVPETFFSSGAGSCWRPASFLSHRLGSQSELMLLVRQV